jgi:AcrR family transcriptional regulator
MHGVNLETRAIRKRSNGRATARRIIEAAVNILREEGTQHVTTTRLAEASGIVQSGFYTHFQNTEEVIAIAADHTAKYLRDVIRSLQDELVALRGGTVAEVARHFVQVFELLLRDRHFTELYLQYRRSPSPLGEVLRRFESNATSDIADELAKVTHPEDPVQNVLDQQQAELILGYFSASMDILLRCDDPEARLENLAFQLALVTKLGVDFAYSSVDRQVYADRFSPDFLRLPD